MRTIFLKVGARQFVVKNLQKAIEVMGKIAPPGSVPDPEAANVRRILNQAIEGHCSNEAAYRAFETLAEQRGLVREVQNGTAVVEFLRATNSSRPLK